MRGEWRRKDGCQRNRRRLEDRRTQRSENVWGGKEGGWYLRNSHSESSSNYICPDEADVVFNAISETKSTRRISGWEPAYDKDKRACRQVWLKPGFEEVNKIRSGAASWGLQNTSPSMGHGFLPDQKILLLICWNQYLISDKINPFLTNKGLADAAVTEWK